MKKRILSMLLILCLVIGIISTAAFAASEVTVAIYRNGHLLGAFDETNRYYHNENHLINSDSTGANAVMDFSTNTLTLDNLDLTGRIKVSGGDITVVLNETNKINYIPSSIYDPNWLIFCEDGGLEIKGPGSLELSSEDGSSSAIHASGEITISDGAKIDGAITGTAQVISGGNVIITGEGTSVKATATGSGRGINVGNGDGTTLTVTDGATLEAVSTDKTALMKVATLSAEGSTVTVGESAPGSAWDGTTDINTYKYVKIVGGQGAAHVHSWTYTASGATITASCGGAGTCDFSGNTSITIKKPTLTKYQGSGSKEATIADSKTSVGGVNELVIKYQKAIENNDWQDLPGAPTIPGNYRAFILIDSQLAYVEYTIAKKSSSFYDDIDGDYAITDITHNSFKVTIKDVHGLRSLALEYAVEDNINSDNFTPVELDGNYCFTVTVDDELIGDYIEFALRVKAPDEYTEPGTMDTELVQLSAEPTPTPAEAPTIGTDLSTTEVTYVKDAAATALSITASVTDGGMLTYQWYKNDEANTTTPTLLDGVTEASYTPATSAVGTTYYYCVITNTKAGQTATATSAIAMITVNEPAPTYTVTFDANGRGTAPDPITNVTSGNTISAPTAPEASGWTFGGWYKEAGCENAWNFSTDTVDANTTLYAKWTPVVNYNLWVAGVQITSSNASNITGSGISGSVSYDAATNTLTLNNAAVAYPDQAIRTSSSDLIIELVGDNTVTGEYNNGNSTYGMYIRGDLSFTGNGSLTASSADTTAGNSWSVAILATGDITINHGCTITAICGSVGQYGNRAAPIYPYGGAFEGNSYISYQLVLNGAKVSVASENADGSSPVTYNPGSLSSYKYLKIEPASTYTVTFNTNGHGTAPDPITNVTSGNTISAPTAPEASGWTFGGWYKEAGCENAWNFSTDTVTENTTLYAKWTEVIAPPPPPPYVPPVIVHTCESVCPVCGKCMNAECAEEVCADKCSGEESAFTDVPENAWYTEAIEYVSHLGLMNGVSEGQFAPEMTTSRGMIVTILWRLETEPEMSIEDAFADIESGAWYAEAVAWAEANGIVNGYDNGNFGPNDNVTREQLATILWRYAQYKGCDVSVGEDTNILSYEDAFDISEYAIPAMQWACGEGVVTGRGGGILDPLGDASRCEVATMLMRFIENALKA